MSSCFLRMRSEILKGIGTAEPPSCIFYRLAEAPPDLIELGEFVSTSSGEAKVRFYPYLKAALICFLYCILRPPPALLSLSPLFEGEEYLSKVKSLSGVLFCVAFLERG